MQTGNIPGGPGSIPPIYQGSIPPPSGRGPVFVPPSGQGLVARLADSINYRLPAIARRLDIRYRSYQEFNPVVSLAGAQLFYRTRSNGGVEVVGESSDLAQFLALLPRDVALFGTGFVSLYSLESVVRTLAGRPFVYVSPFDVTDWMPLPKYINDTASHPKRVTISACFNPYTKKFEVTLVPPVKGAPIKWDALVDQFKAIRVRQMEDISISPPHTFTEGDIIYALERILGRSGAPNAGEVRELLKKKAPEAKCDSRYDPLFGKALPAATGIILEADSRISTLIIRACEEERFYFETRLPETMFFREWVGRLCPDKTIQWQVFDRSVPYLPKQPLRIRWLLERLFAEDVKHIYPAADKEVPQAL